MIAEKAECDGSEESKGRQFTVVESASQCRGVSSLFLFGSYDYSSIDQFRGRHILGVFRIFDDNRCFYNGCNCACETIAKNDGTCPRISHNGYRLYKFGIPTAKG